MEIDAKVARSLMAAAGMSAEEAFSEVAAAREQVIDLEESGGTFPEMLEVARGAGAGGDLAGAFVLSCQSDPRVDRSEGMRIANAIRFDGDIDCGKGKINFYVMAVDELTKLVVDNSFFDDDDNSINIYLDYDCAKGAVDGEIVFVLRAGGGCEEIVRPVQFSGRAREKIERRMDLHCREVSGRGLDDIAKEEIALFSCPGQGR